MTTPAGEITSGEDPPWLLWARELKALAQTGLAFSKDEYDLERYERIRALAAAIYARGSDTPMERIHSLFAQETGYATPKVDVRGAVFRDQRILLVQEATDGGWTLPGGWADVNQSRPGGRRAGDSRGVGIRSARRQTGGNLRLPASGKSKPAAELHL